MSICFKLLVEFNNEKYSVFVESDYKLIKFKTVSNEIIKQLKQNISLKTHSFEIFDNDFKEYVLITNENQLVENLSRIRVKSKDIKELTDSSVDVNERLRQLSVSVDPSDCCSKQLPEKSIKNLDSFCDYLFEPNQKKLVVNRDDKAVADSKSVDSSPVKNCSSANYLNDFIKNDLSEKNKDFEKYLFDCSESTDRSVKQKNFRKNFVEDISDRKSVSTDNTVVEIPDNQSISSVGQTSSQSPTDAINYLEIQLMDKYGTSSDCPHLYYQTSVRNIQNQFVVIIRYRVQDFKAIQQLLDLLPINRRCFQNNPSNSDPLNPKWKLISDQMKNNGFHEWSPKKCEDGFNNALDLYKKTIDKCPDYFTADKINPLFSELHYFDLKFIISLNEFNVIRDLRFMFENKLRKTKKFCSNQSLVSMNKLKDNYSSKSQPKQSDRLFWAQTYGSNLSLHSMSNTYEKKLYNNKSQIDKTKLKKVKDKINDSLIGSFKALVKSVNTVVQQFGHVSQIVHFWQLVSNQMKVNGYKSYSPMDCYTMFTEHICDYYSLAMTYSSDVNSAQELYPLFDYIHSMDLSKCLSVYSYNKIIALRQQFNNKSQIF